MANPAYVFDRAKYLAILESDGGPAALTALHRDIEHWEYGAFEGQEGAAGDGYNASRVGALKAARDFSRELWNLSLKQIGVA